MKLFRYLSLWTLYLSSTLWYVLRAFVGGKGNYVFLRTEHDDFNISLPAVRGFTIGWETASFMASYNGRVEHTVVKLDDVLTIRGYHYNEE